MIPVHAKMSRRNHEIAKKQIEKLKMCNFRRETESIRKFSSGEVKPVDSHICL